MNPRETKFILRAHRGDGRYAPDDPVFAEALATTERTPELAAWLAREHVLDTTVANKLDAIQPPAALRETILAGARASRLSRPWWRRPSWLAVAATVAVIASAVTLIRPHPGAPPASSALTEFALRDVEKDDHDHDQMSAASLVIADRVAADDRPIPAALNLGYDDLRAAGCASFTLAGHEVLELCIERNGAWFHLYAVRVSGPTAPSTGATLTERGRLAALTWTTGNTVFTLATNEGPAALRRVT